MRQETICKFGLFELFGNYMLSLCRDATSFEQRNEKSTPLAAKMRLQRGVLD